MKRKLVFWTAFNSYQSSKLMRDLPAGSIHPVKTEAWTRKRVDLFKKYTLKSILNQTHEDFFYIVLLDPELKHLTEPLLPQGDERVIYCYEDEATLKRLREYDEIVLALIDNDDMYSKRAGETMMWSMADWMYFKHGYAYEAKKNRLWSYDTIGSGPFFARRIDPNSMTRFDRDKRHPIHKAVINYKPEVLPDNNFCVLLHDVNTSSNVNMQYVKEIVSIDILKKEFGQ